MTEYHFTVKKEKDSMIFISTSWSVTGNQDRSKLCSIKESYHLELELIFQFSEKYRDDCSCLGVINYSYNAVDGR